MTTVNRGNNVCVAVNVNVTVILSFLKRESDFANVSYRMNVSESLTFLTVSGLKKVIKRAYRFMMINDYVHLSKAKGLQKNICQFKTNLF